MPRVPSRERTRLIYGAPAMWFNLLRLALWAFYHGNSFREGCLLAVNLGDDADTTGAVYGQLAGAYYGEEGIPEDWREKVSHHELIVSFAEKLFGLSMHGKV